MAENWWEEAPVVDGEWWAEAPAFEPERNPDGTYGQPPEGYIANPQTGQMTGRDLMVNNAQTSRAKSMATGAARGLSFGGADEIMGGINAVIPTGGTMGERYAYGREYQRAQEEAARRDNPIATGVSEVAGALAVPVGTISQAGSLPVRMGKSAAQGAGLGAVYGALTGEDTQDRLEGVQSGAAWGAGIGAAVPAIGGAIEKATSGRRVDRAAKQLAKGAPSSDDLRTLGQQQYQQVDDLGVQIKPEAFERNRQQIVDYLRKNTGFDELPGPGSLTPKTGRVMQIMGNASDEMASAQGANPGLPFKSLDQMRRQAGAAAGNVTEKADQQAGMGVIQGLDDFVQRLTDDDVLAGDVQQLPSLITKARETWSRMSKSQKIDDAMEAAENYRWGFSNGIKYQFKKILNNPKLARGFSDAEKRAMQRVVKGSIPEKALEFAGSGLTSIGGILGGTLGMASGGIPALAAGAAVSAGSMGARRAADSVARKNAEIARALISSGKAANMPAQLELKSRPLIEQLMRQGTVAATQ